MGVFRDRKDEEKSTSLRMLLLLFPSQLFAYSVAYGKYINKILLEAKHLE